MSCLRVHFYTPTACRATHAFSSVFPRSFRNDLLTFRFVFSLLYFALPCFVICVMAVDTGDRPYKCTHCGDQFARRCVRPSICLTSPHHHPLSSLLCQSMILTYYPSDLLSRHVNKCHSAAKPPTTTQPARRRGHAQPGPNAGGVRGPPPTLNAPPRGLEAGGSLGGLRVVLPGLARRICDACAGAGTPAQCDAGQPCGAWRSFRLLYVPCS
jgi:hypothetical protein